MVTWEWKSVKQGGRDRRVRQGGNRDEWKGGSEKGIRGVMEKG